MFTRLDASAGLAPAGQDDVTARMRVERDEAVQAALAALRDTTRVTRLLTILGEPASPAVWLDRVLSALSELFTADIVLLVAPNASGRFATLAAIGLPEAMVGQVYQEAQPRYELEAIREGKAIRVDHASHDPAVALELRELGVETVALVPVRGGDHPIGVLLLARCRAAPFAHAEVDLLAAMAYRMGLMLEQVQRGARLEQIVRTGREIARYLDEGTVRAEAVRTFKDVVDADAAMLLEIDADNYSRCVAQIGLSDGLLSSWSVPVVRLLAADCLVSGEPFSTPDLRTLTQDYDALEPYKLRAMLALPIGQADGTRALLYALRRANADFSAEAVQVAKLYAVQLAAALQNARLYRTAQEELAERVRAEAALRDSEERFRA